MEKSCFCRNCFIDCTFCSDLVKYSILDGDYTVFDNGTVENRIKTAVSRSSRDSRLGYVRKILCQQQLA